MKTSYPEDSVPSPCVSRCCLGDDDICLGCYRHIDEIIGWHSASVEDKKAVLQRCEERKTQRSQD